MTTERFCEGDIVDLVPYTAVVDNCGLNSLIWGAFENRNPHVIRRTRLNRDGTVRYYELEGDAMRWCWPPEGFVLHERQTEVEVGDLL